MKSKQERESRLVGETNRQRDRNLTQGLISMPLLFPMGNTVTALRTPPTPPFPQMLLLSFKDTLQIHHTCLPAPQGGNIVHQLHMLQRIVSFSLSFS